jgi:hypothetical protein
MSLAPDQRIRPEKITKPFQLLAAWLVGLILVNASLLSAACLIKEPAWVAPMLTIAAIADVPLFLVAIFLLQTKFRPQMQEDPYYSKFLENQNTKSPQSNAVEEIAQVRVQISESQKQTLEIIKGVQNQMEGLKNEIVVISKKTGHDVESKKWVSHFEAFFEESLKNIRAAEKKTDWSGLEVKLNDLLPEFQNIRQALVSNGIAITELFGSTSMPPIAPSIFVLSVGLGVPINELRQIVNLLRPFRIAAMTLNLDAADLHSIYIGSYLYGKIKVTPLDEQVIAAISNANRTEDLKGVINTFSIRDIKK